MKYILTGLGAFALFFFITYLMTAFACGTFDPPRTARVIASFIAFIGGFFFAIGIVAVRVVSNEDY